MTSDIILCDLYDNTYSTNDHIHNVDIDGFEEEYEEKMVGQTRKSNNVCRKTS